jgi:ABC-type glycerol-3-phosphate transport system substrate-binding protein
MRFAFLLALIAVCGALVACGGGSTPSSELEKAEANVAEVEEKNPGPWANICAHWFGQSEQRQAELVSEAGSGTLKYQDVSPATMAEAISAACGGNQ